MTWNGSGPRRRGWPFPTRRLSAEGAARRDVTLNEILTGIADLVLSAPLHHLRRISWSEHGPLPFCPPCMEGIRFIRSPLCPRCGIPFPATEGEDHLCGDCLAAEKPYAVARAVGRYEETLLTAIHRFKYRGRTGIGEILGRIMADFAGGDLGYEGFFERIVPVPLHRKRLRERGFNQAVILAREIAKRFDIPLDFMIAPAGGLHAAAGRFGTGRPVGKRPGRIFGQSIRRRIAGRRILLVDDVYYHGEHA